MKILLKLDDELITPQKRFENNVQIISTYINLKQFDKAYSLIEKLAAETEELYSEHSVWNVYFTLVQGQYYLKRSQFEVDNDLKANLLIQAVKNFSLALEYNVMNEDGLIPYLDTEKGDFVTPTQVNEAFINRAIALEDLFNIRNNGSPESLSILEDALRTYQAAIDFTYGLKVSLKDEESKLLLSEYQSDIYIDAFNVAFELFEITGNKKYKAKLFEIAEQSKSSTFLSSLNDVQALNFGGIPDSILQQEKNIKLQLTNYKQLIFNADVKTSTDSMLLAQWQTNLFQLEKDYDNLMYVLEREYKDYYNFKYKKSTIQPKHIRKTLKSNQVLLEYLVDEPTCEGDSGNVYVLKITDREFEILKNPISYSYIENLNTLHGILSSRNVANTNKKDYIDYVNSAYGLYCDLIAPFMDYSREMECIVVPDDKMAYIPLDALISSYPDTTRMNFRDLSYLIYDYNFSYSYSSTLHFDYFKSKTSFRNEVLAFAPEYNGSIFDLNKEAYEVRQTELMQTLRPLPGAQKEVEALKANYKCDAFVGNYATETEFKIIVRILIFCI